MTLFPVLVDVYHKEQLVTQKEAEKCVSGVYTEVWEGRWEKRWERRWARVAVTKDASTATRIGVILDKYGFNDAAKYSRGKCVYSRLCV